ncbi:MAG: hypothetical protein PHX62_00560 [Bacilli bacterium]|nr:hypothetical protein [Bacilli bacterium]
MTNDKIIQIFLEHSIDRVLDSIIENPKKGVNNLLNILKDTDYNSLLNHSKIHQYLKNENSPLYPYLQTQLKMVNRKTLKRFIIHVFSKLKNTSTKQVKIINFDFKSEALSPIQIENLLSRTNNILYICLNPRKDYSDLNTLIEVIKKQTSLFFLFLEPEQIASTKELLLLNNICILIKADNYDAFSQSAAMLSKNKVFYGAYLVLNDDNLQSYTASIFLETLKSTKIFSLVYLRESSLQSENYKTYLKFLKNFRFVYFPILDFSRDQEYLYKNITKEI